MTYEMDSLTREQRTKNMKAIRSSGTKIELILGRALWANGIRYRKHPKGVLGKPDFAHKTLKIAVFVDGEFWHGKDWEIRKHWIKSNREFWYPKIERTIARDRQVTEQLTQQGWIVIRIWGDEVLKNLDDCISKIQRAVTSKRGL